MDLDLAFRLCTYSVFPAWILLAVAPRWSVSQGLALATSLAIAAVYGALVFPFLQTGEGDMASLEGVRTSFDSRHIVFIGWIHYLSFDLFIGAWEARDASRLGLPRVVVAPFLLLTLLLGPLGLLAYMGLRAVMRRRFSADEAAPT